MTDYQKIIDVKEYNEYNRKIRRIIEALTKQKFLKKSIESRPHYTINQDFERVASLFDK